LPSLARDDHLGRIENTRSFRTGSFVTPFQVDQNCRLTYDCIWFENLNLSRSNLPLSSLPSKKCDYHICLETNNHRTYRVIIAELRSLRVSLHHRVQILKAKKFY
jgi:hypothetical protein